MKFIYVILIGLFVATGGYAQGDHAPAPAVEELYLAKDDGKGKAGDQVSEFGTSDIPIYCIVLLERAAKVTVKMNFVAVRVSGVKTDTEVVTASYITKEGQNRVNFSGRPDDKWTPGKYRVEIFLNGKIAKNVEFEIKSIGSSATASKFVSSTDTSPPPKRSRKP